MSFNVTEFRANILGDGARPNLFSVSLVFPTIVANGTASGQKTTFMAKTAQLPGSTVGTVPVYYEVKVVDCDPKPARKLRERKHVESKFHLIDEMIL